MKKKDIFEDDPLRQILDSLEIEKAPEGFSPKLMSLVYLEAKVHKKEKRNSVPIISAIVVAILSGAALLLPESSFPVDFFRIPENIIIRLPELKTGFEIPGILMPVMAGIILLIVFDAVIKEVFGNRKYQG